MSGHSKWNNIKNRKGAMDEKKAKDFAQVAKMIRIAVREGKSGDAKLNPSLRIPLEKARAVNMPNDKIQRAIDTGLGNRGGKAVQEIIYEGFGPGGVGLLIETTTDNTQRTSAEMKFILSRHGGNLGGPGTAMYLFTRQQETMEYFPTMPFVVEDPATAAQLDELEAALRANDEVEDIYFAATWTTL